MLESRLARLKTLCALGQHLVFKRRRAAFPVKKKRYVKAKLKMVPVLIIALRLQSKRGVTISTVEKICQAKLGIIL